MPKGVTCRELIEFLDDYVSNQLAPEMRQAFERHLNICKHCRDYLTTYRETIVLARGAMRDDDADRALEIPAELVQAILAARALA